MLLHLPARATEPPNNLCPRHSRLNSLLALVGEGDRDAFSTFYDEVGRSVYGLSLSTGQAPARSAQITVDVFSEVWRRAGTYDPNTESAWTWVRALASEAQPTAGDHGPE